MNNPYSFSIEHTDRNPCNVKLLTAGGGLLTRAPLSVSPSSAFVCQGKTVSFQVTGGSGSYIVQVPENNQTYQIASNQVFNFTPSYTQVIRVYDASGGDCDNALSIEVPIAVKTDCEPASKPNLTIDLGVVDYRRRFPCAPFDTILSRFQCYQECHKL